MCGRATAGILHCVNRATGSGTAKENGMKTSSIRVGVIADQTGPLSFVGLANANVARMVIGDILSLIHI